MPNILLKNVVFKCIQYQTKIYKSFTLQKIMNIYTIVIFWHGSVTSQISRRKFPFPTDTYSDMV